jgi:phytol kinase
MWVWAILALFDTWQIGLIPFGTFIILNYVFYRLTIFQAMDTEESTPGTVYFAFSITLLYALFWRTDGQSDRAVIATGAVMAMTWGVRWPVSSAGDGGGGAIRCGDTGAPSKDRR